MGGWTERTERIRASRGRLHIQVSISNEQISIVYLLSNLVHQMPSCIWERLTAKTGENAGPSISQLLWLSEDTRVLKRECLRQGFGSGVFAWIRIRFSNLSGSGSGFQISLDPDLDPVFKFLRIRFFNFSGYGSGFRPGILRQKKECRKGPKVI